MYANYPIGRMSIPVLERVKKCVCERQETIRQLSVFVMQKDFLLSLWCCVSVETLIIGMHSVSAILTHAKSKAL